LTVLGPFAGSISRLLSQSFFYQQVVNNHDEISSFALLDSQPTGGHYSSLRSVSEIKSFIPHVLDIEHLTENFSRFFFQKEDSWGL